MYQSTPQDTQQSLVHHEIGDSSRPEVSMHVSDADSLLNPDSTHARAKQYFTRRNNSKLIIGCILLLLIGAGVGVAIWRTSISHDDQNNNNTPQNGTWVTFYHLTDVHGWINGHPHTPALNADWGDLLSLGQHMSLLARNRNEEFYLFDTGDLIEGTGLSDATPIHGTNIYNATVQLSRYIPYGGLTLGNHDEGYNETIDQVFEDWVPGFNQSFVTSNTNYTKGDINQPVGSPYRVITTPLGHHILVLGYIFNFTQNSGNTRITPMEETWFTSYFYDAMNVENVDIIVTINHADPINSQKYDLQRQWQEIRKYHPNTPLVILGGHAHSYYQAQYDPQTIVMESGKYFQKIGVLRFLLNNSTGAMSSVTVNFTDTSITNFLSMSETTSDTFLTNEGKMMKQQLTTWTQQLGLDRVLGCSPSYYDNYLPAWVNTSFYNLWINQIIPSSYNLTFSNNTRFYITSSSSIRSSLYAGNVTYEDILAAQPFKDENYVIRNVNSTQISQLVYALFTKEFGSVAHPHKIHTCDEDEDQKRQIATDNYNTEQYHHWKQQQHHHAHVTSLQGTYQQPTPPKNVTSAPYYATIDTFYLQTPEFISAYANTTFDIISPDYFNRFFTQVVFDKLGYPELTKSELYPGLYGTATAILSSWISANFKC